MTGNLYDEWRSIKDIPVLESSGDGYPRLFDEDFYTPDPAVAGARLPLFLSLGRSGVSAAAVGNANITQDAETLSAGGAVAVAGAGSSTQGAGTLSAAGAIAVAASASLTQGAHTLAATGVTVAGTISGSANLTQGAEAVAAAGAVAVAGSASLTQSAETLSAAGAAPISGSAALTQSGQSLSAAAAVAVHATGANTQGANTLAAAGGTPTSFSIIEVAAGEGYSDVSPKQLVRTAGNVLYIVTVNADNYPGGDLTNRIRVVKGDQTGLPSSFTEKDVANRPTGGIAQWGAAIDSTGIIHIIYALRTTTANSNIVDIRYITFNTATDTYGTSVSIDNTVNFTEDGGNQGHESVSIAIDAADFPHIVYLANVGGVRRMRYRNKTSGSWSAATTIDDQTLTGNQKIWHPNLVFDINGRILFQWHIGTFNDTADAQMWIRTRETNGTLNASVAVSAANALLTGIDNTASMIVTADNRYHVTWMNGSTTPANKYIRYAYSDNGGTTWTRNDPGGGVQATHNPSLGPNGKGGVRIYGHGTPDASNHGINLYYFDGAGGPATWSSWTLWVNNPALDSSVNTRWSQYHHNKPGTLDAIYWNDNYPNFLYYGGEIVIQAAAALTQSAHTLSATGTNAGAGISGSASLTQGAETVSAAGAVAVAGAAALTQTAQSATAAGALAIAGSAGLTQSAETLAAAGTAAVAGSANISQSAETLTSSGTVKVSGAAALTQGAETAAGLGTTAIAGTAALTQGAETLNGVGATTIAGVVALTQGAQSSSAAGAVAVVGAGSNTQGAHTLSAIGVTDAGSIHGSAALTQAAQSLTSAGLVAVSGSAAITQAAETSSAGGTVAVRGTSSLTQSAETVSASGSVPAAGAAALTQSPESLSAAGSVPARGSASLTQGAETLVAAGAVGAGGVSGSASITQGAMTVTGGGSVTIRATASPTEGSDTLSGVGAIAILGAGSVTQGAMTLSGLGSAALDGTIYTTINPVDDLDATHIVTQVAQIIQVNLRDSDAAWGTVTLTEIPTVISPIIGDPTDQGGVTVLAGALPPGLTFNPTTGAISGTPTKAGTYIFTIDATDSTVPSAVGSRTYTIVVT